ncbi:MAG TPA: protein kinase [Polyangiaceae bacterium]|nr:protein kinase [Polyangiaceae bacterium]
MVDPALLRDRVLVGRYRLDERLGAGGMGSIWRAYHLVLQAPVAVKLIDREAVADEETLGRFMREAQSAATLRSPHVVQILDYGVDDKLPFIVMELLDGENLAQRLRRQGRLGSADTARIVTHIGRAMARAHEANIVHRDLKPENVFLIRNEDEEIAKVLDFGVAKVAVGELGEQGSRTRTGSILGTPYYMSPEQAQGNKTVDHRSDLWSLGVIAFECLTGKRPFYSDGLGDLVLQICIRDIPVPSESSSVPVGFDAWFARAVSRDPETRFQSARELTDALREVLGGDARELQWTSPEVATSAELTPNSQARTRLDGAGSDPRASAAQLAESNSQIRLSAGGNLLADPSAATLFAGSAPSSGSSPTSSRGPISSRGSGPTSSRAPLSSPHNPPISRRAESEVIAQLLASAESEPPRRRSGAGLVLSVAGVALAIGLGAGWVFMKRNDLPRLRPLPAAVPPARDSAAPRAHSSKPPEHAPSAHEEPSASASTTASAAASAKPAPTVHATQGDAPLPVVPTSKPAASPSASVAPPPSTTADAGWVKPAWAIPDEEPRRVHTDDAHDAGK